MDDLRTMLSDDSTASMNVMVHIQHVDDICKEHPLVGKALRESQQDVLESVEALSEAEMIRQLKAAGFRGFKDYEKAKRMLLREQYTSEETYQRAQRAISKVLGI